MNRPHSEKNQRILVIDDNRSIHDDFRKILGGTAGENAALAQAEAALFDEQAQTPRLAEFQIDSAYQGQEGLALVQQSIQARQPYAVAFVDVRMPPGWDGVETTQRLWEIDPDLQVVICTAYSDYSWDEMINKIGTSDRMLILKKPFDTVEVIQMVHALTEKWRLLQEVKRHVDELELKVAGRTRELEEANEKLQVEVAERKQAEGTLQIKTDQLQAITDSMVAFLQNGDARLPNSILLRNALAQTGSTCGFIAVVDDSPALRVLSHVCAGWDEAVLQRTLEGTDDGDQERADLVVTNLRKLFRAVVTSGQAVISNEPDADSRSAEGRPAGTLSLQCFLGVPVLKGTQVVGMIGVANRSGAYTGVEQSRIEILTHAAGILFDSFRSRQREAALEQQLRQAQKVEAIGRLAGGVAHDFNNILTAILGYAELMLMRLKPDDALHRNAEEIQKAAQRAAKLTRQLLAFSRRQIMEVKVVNLNDLVNNLGTMLRSMIGEDIELIIRCAKDLGRVKVDPGQIEQVITNLAVNARDAMSQDGKLIIETANVVLDETFTDRHEDVTPGNYVMLAVSDTGTGMTAEVQARLFEPFFTTKEKGKGTGLGLATCYGIIKQSGGHITVYSEPAQGTTFKIYLPRVEQAAAVEPRQDESHDLPRGKETLLLVEDEGGLRGLACLILRGLGYTVLEASNGCEALRITEERNGQGVDLVVTDVVMPQMGGKELADQIHAKHPEAKVLFSSGYTEDKIVHQGVLDDGICFLQKPYTPAALARKVRETLDA